MQRTLTDFPERLEEITDKIEERATQLEGGGFGFDKEFDTPINDPVKVEKVAEAIGKEWDKIYHAVAFDKVLDIILSALERRDKDYLKLIDGMDRKVLGAIAGIHDALYNFFINGNYGDPLGHFYMEHISYGKGGEFYTPFNIAVMMAKILDPDQNDRVCDPCVGSGTMLLATRYVIHEKYGWVASSRFGRNLYGIDISLNATKMAKINLYYTDYVYQIYLTMDVVDEFINKGKVDHPQEPVESV